MVFIVDDNFIGNKKNVRDCFPISPLAKSNGYPFSLLTESSVNLADDEALLENMRRAGFAAFSWGLKPRLRRVSRRPRRRRTSRQPARVGQKIQSYGMEVMAGFIVGFDNDPEDIFERQIDFIRQSAIPLAMVGLLTALPDTQLWRRLDREGRLLGEHGEQH